jgi:hypothetical protein
LRLPDGGLPANNGIAHRDECLRRLALFNLLDPSFSSAQDRVSGA